MVTHRQRPATASGITFLNLEDEHGLVNVICSVGVWNRYRRVVRDSPALIVRGMLERSPEGVTNLLADGFEDLRVGVRTAPATSAESRRRRGRQALAQTATRVHRGVVVAATSSSRCRTDNSGTRS